MAEQLYVLTNAFALLSVTFLICRIATVRRDVAIMNSMAAILCAWILISLLFQTFKCGLPDPWIFSPPSRCLDRRGIAYGNAAINTTFELCNVTMAYVIVWHVQMQRRLKAHVLIAFTLRLLYVVRAITQSCRKLD